MEATPLQNLQKAKIQKHHYKVSSQAFSLDKRDFILYNLSLKKDYSDDYDFINFRRGLTYLEEIVDFKHSQAVVARKGLRKFRDLMAQYLDIKQSHVNTSKHHTHQRERLFKTLEESTFKSYKIYNSQKVNGQNAQISVIDQKYWLIGSKNKCLLAQTEEDLETLKNKHEYNQNILIARTWFNLLKDKTEEEIKAIKLQLSDKTLVGEYCNMNNMQHLINYGNQAQLFFYALIQKNNLSDDCFPLSTTLKFLQSHKLPEVQCQIKQTKTIEHTLQELRQIVVKINQMSMKEGGQGSVLYVSGIGEQGQKNLVICKVKTIEYRIFRKLREKLKVYLQKYNKHFDTLLKKYTKEIGQIAREFHLNKPLDQYIQLARRAFILCQDQNRPVSRFISNRYIDFLNLLSKNITKDKFMEIVNSNKYEADEEEEQEQNTKQENGLNEGEEKIEKKEEQGKESIQKKVLVLIPLSIPSSGKTTLLQIIKGMKPNFRIWSISSDQIKRQLMEELMKKMKNINKKQAFQKSGDRTNKIFYSQMGEVFKNIATSTEQNHVFFIDKNHPESAVKPSVKNIDQKSSIYPNLKVVKVALLPACKQLMAQKGLYKYPFSSAFMITCLKRVINRPEHLTLEGSDQDRAKIVIGFANLFRGFSVNKYNLQKYFNTMVQFTLSNESCMNQEHLKGVSQLFKEVLLKGRPGKFDEVHPRLQQLVAMVKKCELQQSNSELGAKQGLLKLEYMFEHFEQIGFKQIQ